MTYRELKMAIKQVEAELEVLGKKKGRKSLEKKLIDLQLQLPAAFSEFMGVGQKQTRGIIEGGTRT